eukprot:6051616-Heterocapsa_arctica.AAC.1
MITPDHAHRLSWLNNALLRMSYLGETTRSKEKHIIDIMFLNKLTHPLLQIPVTPRSGKETSVEDRTVQSSTRYISRILCAPDVEPERPQ